MWFSHWPTGNLLLSYYEFLKTLEFSKTQSFQKYTFLETLGFENSMFFKTVSFLETQGFKKCRFLKTLDFENYMFFKNSSVFQSPDLNAIILGNTKYINIF